MRGNGMRAAWFASTFGLGLLATTGAPSAQTIGPGGEAATPSSEIKLSDAEVAKLKGGKYTAALLWHTSSDFVNAVTAGAKDEFARLGMDVVAQTDAGFDAAKQKNDVDAKLAQMRQLFSVSTILDTPAS